MIFMKKPSHLKVVKGGKEKVVKKPNYVFIDSAINELKKEMNDLEREIRNFRFIVETNNAKNSRSFFKSKRRLFSQK